jgi:hypothetical protein
MFAMAPEWMDSSITNPSAGVQGKVLIDSPLKPLLVKLH